MRGKNLSVETINIGFSFEKEPQPMDSVWHVGKLAFFTESCGNSIENTGFLT